MRHLAGTTVIMYAFYTSDGGIATSGLDVTVDVKENGIKVATVNANDEDDGWYNVVHTMTHDASVSSTFHARGDILDVRDVPALGFDILALKIEDEGVGSVGEKFDWISQYAITGADINGIQEAIAVYLDAKLATTGYLVVGIGRGSVLVTDTVVTSKGKPILDALVKAYEIVDGTYIWNRMIAMNTTDVDGRYVLYLDPGTYVLSIEVDYIQLATKEITVA